MNPLYLLAALLIPAIGVPSWLFFRLVRRSQYTVTQTILWLIAKVIARLLWRLRVEGKLPIPDRSGAVVICNHRSSVDPFFVQTSVLRVIRWMVAKEYYRHWFFGWFLRTCDTIPVNRGGIDTASTKAAIRAAAEGGLVGMFPEGRINTTEKFMRPVRPGAIVVALKAKVPVLPCYIEGAPYGGTAWSPFFMRAKVRVRFGDPIDLSPYYDQPRDSESVRELLKKCVKEIARLAGRDDFEPEIAGRKWKPETSEFDER